MSQSQIQNNSQCLLSEKERCSILSRVSTIGIFGNIILSLFKLIAGIVGHSGAMISDAAHSLSDVIATFVAWIGVKMSMIDADREHPFGHERFECVASIILAGILLLAGLGIGWNQLEHVIHGDKVQIPGKIAMFAAIVSILVKEAMYHYTKACAVKLNSSAFHADAWHHRSDAFSSVGSLIGIAGARMNCPVLDPIAGFIISIFILKVAYDVFRDASSKIVDKSCPEAFEEELKRCIMEEPGVIDIDIFRTRTFGERIYVEAEIGIDGKKTLSEAHRIAENVHDRVELHYPTIKHIIIHENPHD